MDRPEETVALSDNAQLVLNRRYLVKDAMGTVAETPDDMFARVARFIARAEKNYASGKEESLTKAFHRMMVNLEFLPNSPTLMNAGRDLGQLSACFVLPVEDTLDSIFDAVKHTAKIHQTGGGTGFSFSKLRPKDDVVASTMGVASGPVSFMRVFNMATDVIKQGGTRRGANMGVLRIDHPDIEEFVTIKRASEELSNFNLSVAVTDGFMEAYKRGEMFSLLNPRTRKEVRKVSARALFRLIAESAWASGDPGVIFIDTINRFNPTPHLGEIETTNPCVTKDTFVLTAQGPRQVSELLGKPLTLVVDGKPFPSSGKGFFKTGKRPVIRLDTEEGFWVRLTGNHPVLRVASSARSALSTEWVEAESLRPGDRLLLHNHRLFRAWPGDYGEAEGYFVGLLLGEGTPKEDLSVVSIRVPAGADRTLMGASDGWSRASDTDALPVLAPVSEVHVSVKYLKEMAARLSIAQKERAVTPTLEKCSSDFYKGFLRGLFDCDGSAQGTQKKGVSIRLPRKDMQFLQVIQRMLLRLGIVGRIVEERRPDEAGPADGGRRGRKSASARPRYELLITNNNVQYFHQAIGFSDPVKQARLKQLLVSYKRLLNRERFTVTVKTLTAQEAEDVYDVRVPGVNAFDANGFYVHNCGEQPLLPYESCCLGSINLSRLVRDGQVDWTRLRELTHLGVRFLDNVIDMTKHPLVETERITRGNRKIGLGVMGFAHVLIRLGIEYDSKRAEEAGEQIMRFIQKESKAASKMLAEERGAFPNYTGSLWHTKDLLQRNATTTTVAPTGTLSIIANASSGIEPIFDVRYNRVLFGDIQVEVIDPLYAEMREHVEQHEETRRLFRTAFQLAPLAHLRMQRAFQHHVDNAVSKTINLPNDATPDAILDIYVEAHNMGLKGTTIFRDRSRDFQVLSCGTHTC